jgi:hypothetical protein
VGEQQEGRWPRTGAVGSKVEDLNRAVVGREEEHFFCGSEPLEGRRPGYREEEAALHKKQDSKVGEEENAEGDDNEGETRHQSLVQEEAGSTAA